MIIGSFFGATKNKRGNVCTGNELQEKENTKGQGAGL